MKHRPSMSSETSRHTRRFRLYYWSEVSAVIDVKKVQRRNGEWIVIRATHTVDTVGIGDWFHFCDVTSSSDAIVYEVFVDDDLREATLRALHLIAEDLWPGPRFHYDTTNRGYPSHEDEDKQYEHFRQDFIYAFITGELSPAKPEHQSVPEKHWIDDWKSENWDV